MGVNSNQSSRSFPSQKAERARASRRKGTLESVERSQKIDAFVFPQPRLSVDEGSPPSNHENLIEGLSGKDNFLGISDDVRVVGWFLVASEENR